MATEDKNKSPADNADTQNVPAESGDTASEAPTAPQASEGHADTTKPSESTSDTGKLDESQKREEGKLQQTQSELSKVKQELQSAYGWMAKKPKRYKQALVDRGYTETQADDHVKAIHRDYQASKTDEKVSTLTPEQQTALNEVQVVSQAKQKRRNEVAQKYVEKNPAIDEGLKYSIAVEANRLEGTGMAIEDAFRIATVKITKPEEYKQEGIIEGKAQALSGVSSSQGGVGGGTVPSSTGKELDATDKEVMDTLGLNKKGREFFKGHKDS